MKNSHRFMCVSCDDQPVLEGVKAFQHHLKETHEVDGKVPVERRLTYHLDGQEFFESRYVGEVGGVNFVEHIVTKRGKDDPFRDL